MTKEQLKNLEDAHATAVGKVASLALRWHHVKGGLLKEAVASAELHKACAELEELEAKL